MPPASDAVAFHPSWPASVRELVLRAIARHGGWSLWSRLESITLCLVSMRGILPWAKGYLQTFDLPRCMTVHPKIERAMWSEEPSGRCVGVFDRGDVRLIDPASGEVRGESRDHRRTFQGARKRRRW